MYILIPNNISDNNKIERLLFFKGIEYNKYNFNKIDLLRIIDIHIFYDTIFDISNYNDKLDTIPNKIIFHVDIISIDSLVKKCLNLLIINTKKISKNQIIREIFHEIFFNYNHKQKCTFDTVIHNLNYTFQKWY